MIHLAEIKQKDEHLTGSERTGQHEPRAVPKHQTRSASDDDFDQRRQLRFDVSRFQGRLDTGAAFALEPLLLVILARKRFDDANRREHFF